MIMMAGIEVNAAWDGGRRKLPEKAANALVHGISSEPAYVLSQAIRKLDATALYILMKGTAASLANKALSLKAGRQITAWTPQELARAYSIFFNPPEDRIEIDAEGMMLSEELAYPNMWLPLLNVGNIFERNQYRATKEAVQGKVVIDAGAHVGTFSFYAAYLGARKVYAFEPVWKIYGQLRKNIHRNDLGNVIIPVNAALGNENGTAKILLNEDNLGASTLQGSGSTFSPKTACEEESVEIRRLDDFLDGEDFAFLKMDVEGSEEEVLKGAHKTIARCKPILSFSAYHKPTDKERLPEVVRSIRKDYEILLIDDGEPDFLCL